MLDRDIAPTPLAHPWFSLWQDSTMTRIFSVATLVTVVALASGDTAMGQASISLTANAVVQPNDNTKVAFTGTGYFEFNGAGNGTFGSVTIKIRYNNCD